MLGLWLAVVGATEARTHCRFVPERLDDFAWENVKIAFRAYGLAARDRTENSGIDCWLKRVDYPIIDKWYGQMKKKPITRTGAKGTIRITLLRRRAAAEPIAQCGLGSMKGLGRHA